MRVLVACESSGTVREAFRKLGHDAWSCDLLPADDRSAYHHQGDAIGIAMAYKWDLAICHPPCTHLSASGARHWEKKRQDGRQWEGISLFLAFVGLPIKRVAIENPIGLMSSLYRKPDQIINPWQFGHRESKATCLWLRGLPRLKPTCDVYDEMMRLPESKRNRIHRLPPSKDRWKIRSKTYQGIADAMAAQWGGIA
jgi:hypothetical protein